MICSKRLPTLRSPQNRNFHSAATVPPVVLAATIPSKVSLAANKSSPDRTPPGNRSNTSNPATATCYLLPATSIPGSTRKSSSEPSHSSKPVGHESNNDASICRAILATLDIDNCPPLVQEASRDTPLPDPLNVRPLIDSGVAVVSRTTTQPSQNAVKLSNDLLDWLLGSRMIQTIVLKQKKPSFKQRKPRLWKRQHHRSNIAHQRRQCSSAKKESCLRTKNTCAAKATFCALAVEMMFAMLHFVAPRLVLSSYTSWKSMR